MDSGAGATGEGRVLAPDGDHANVLVSVNVPPFLPFPCFNRVKAPVMVWDVVSRCPVSVILLPSVHLRRAFTFFVRFPFSVQLPASPAVITPVNTFALVEVSSALRA